MIYTIKFKNNKTLVVDADSYYGYPGRESLMNFEKDKRKFLDVNPLEVLYILETPTDKKDE